MKVRIITVLFLLLTIRNAAIAGPADTTRYHKILLLAFNPDFYLSDAEHDIINQSKQQPDNYRAFFRRALDNKVSAEAESVIPVYSLLTDTQSSAVSDLYRLYDKATYQYAKIPKEKKISRILSKPDDHREQNANQHLAASYNSDSEDRFMNMTFADTAFISSICEKYQCDLIVSVTQFEIKTNYKSCVDIARHLYNRNCIMHYAILDKHGKFLYGNQATAVVPPDFVTPETIASHCFPAIAKELSSHISALKKP